MTRRAKIVVRGGRLPEHGQDGPMARGQDIAVQVDLDDGRRLTLPVTSLVLRVEGRKALATVELLVDEVDISGITATIPESLIPPKELDR